MGFRFPRDGQTLRSDVSASLVVFLVALPLCLGIALASGVPAELGLITGIVGGLVAGALPGSHLQVSGPAAGLTVLVYETVTVFGLRTLAVIVLAAGLVQMLMGVLRVGRWFRAIAVSVVEGMLAGIGLVLIVGQLHVLMDRPAHGGTLANLVALPATVAAAVGESRSLMAAAVGMGTVVVLVGWRLVPSRLRTIPAPLAAVAAMTAVAAVLRLPVPRIEVRGLLGAVQPPALGELARLADLAVLEAVLAFALVASAESLFSAAAVDAMHDGPRTHYDRELIAQGVGNTVCGLLGALPMTAVIVRSAANVGAGARSKGARVLHGVWLLLFAALAPGALGVIPLAVLAGVLVHVGWRLVPVRELRRLWRADRGEALVLVSTAGTIVASNLLDGVLVGLLLAVAKTAWDVSHVHVDVRDDEADALRVCLTGSATFLRLPRLLDTLEALPHDRPLDLDLSDLRHLDHACRSALVAWAAQRDGRGTPVRLSEPLVEASP